MIHSISNMNVKFTSDDEFIGHGSSKREQITEVFEKMEYDLESAYDKGGSAITDGLQDTLCQLKLCQLLYE